MKKKIILMLAMIIALVCLMVACSDKSYAVSKKSHDSIFIAGEDTYIACEDGKYYLFKTKNSGKVFKTGYDALEYVSGSYSEKYLLAYNSGDIGYTVLKAEDGAVVAVSSDEMKITGAEMFINAAEKDSQTVTLTEKALVIDFINDTNKQGSALYNIDGGVVFFDKNGTVTMKEADTLSNEYTITLTYVVLTTTGTIDGVDDKVVKIEILDDLLNSVYSKTFTKETPYSTSRYDGELSSISYKVLTFTEAGEVDTTTNYTDVVANYEVFTGYTSLVNTLSNEYGEISSYVVSTYNTVTAANTYTLIGNSGVLKTFTATYSVYNNQLRVTNSSGRYEVVRYDSSRILDDVEIYNTDFYASTSSGVKTVYNNEGKTLFNFTVSEVNTVVSDKMEVGESVSEYFKITAINLAVTYKYFLDGVLVKEYGQGYTFVSTTDTTITFTTKTNLGVVDYYYIYNFAANSEKKIAADSSGNEDVSVSGSFYLINGNAANYYVEEDSQTISFVNGIVEDIAPYGGEYIAGYSVSGHYSFTAKYISYNGDRYTYIVLAYDLLTKTADEDSDPITYTYKETGDIMYAYYLVKDNTTAPKTELLYSGYNYAEVTVSNTYDILVISTVDKFADIYTNNIYSSFARLADITSVYGIAADINGALTLIKKSDIAKSNMENFTDNYITFGNYIDTAYLKTCVYSLEGAKVLDALYTVSDINGDLALISVLGKYGVYNLAKGKVLEKVTYSVANVLAEDVYMTGIEEENGMVYTFKNSKGKKIVDGIYAFVYLGSMYNLEDMTIIASYSLYLGEDEFKLFTIIYDTKIEDTYLSN